MTESHPSIIDNAVVPTTAMLGSGYRWPRLGEHWSCAGMEIEIMVIMGNSVAENGFTALRKQS